TILDVWSGKRELFVGRLDWIYYVIEELSRHRMHKKTVVTTKFLDHSVFSGAQTCSLQWLTRMLFPSSEGVISVSLRVNRVKAYEKLKHLQGTLLAQFYGLFTATLPAQHNRTVHVILLEEVPGTDLRLLLPPKVAEKVCSRHREAIFDRVINLYLDLCDCGINQHDMHPRNVILRPQEHVVPGTRFCNTDNCPLTLQVDCDDFHLVMIDFECVEFEEEDFFAEMRAYRQRDLDELKVQCREEGWLEGEMQWD
ncbi:hypothetical protein AGABI1DRAFT_95991, partial [Agaricus bisporus var. burnettii JB137-S8]